MARAMPAPTLSWRVEADAALGGVERPGGRLADIVQQDGEDERDGDLRGQQGEHGAGVDPDVALRVELRGLLAALEREHLRDDLRQQAALVEQVQAAHPVGAEEDADQLLADALGADGVDFRGLPLQRLPGGGVDFELEDGGETDCAQHPQAILAETARCVADGAQEAEVEVRATADEVDYLLCEWVVEHAVDGEVAALGILAGSGKRDGFGVAAIDVGAVGAEGGDFELPAVLEDADDAEMRAHGDGAREEALDFLRAGAGGDVVVLGLDAAQHVADAAAGEIGDVAGIAETANDGQARSGGRLSSAFGLRNRNRCGNRRP